MFFYMKTPEDVSLEVSALRAQVAVGIAVLKADHSALLSYVSTIAKHGGITSIDGVSPLDWYERQRLVGLEKFLIGIEDDDPATAALVQQMIDEMRKRLP